MKLKIGILGCRGIPNCYGGFEQVATSLSAELIKRGHELLVYNTHDHPYKKKSWNTVKIVHRYNPEKWLGTIGQFIYDFLCLLHSRKQQFDILLILGYTSSSVFSFLYPSNTVIITNMDGLEWRRDKYSKLVKRFLILAEKWAALSGDFHIADSIAIKEYLDQKYKMNCRYISYGTECVEGNNLKLPDKVKLPPNEYFLVIARIEPENNIEMILDGFILNGFSKKIVVIGNTETRYGRKVVIKYKQIEQIIFSGGFFDKTETNSLIKYSRLYFHGHSVGGTNPSLLEAMSGGALIAAYDCVFNKIVLQGNGFYFKNSEHVAELMNMSICEKMKDLKVQQNIAKVKTDHCWEKIAKEYESFMFSCLNIKK